MGRPKKSADDLPPRIMHARGPRGRGNSMRARQFYAHGCSVAEIAAYLGMRSHAVRGALMNLPMLSGSTAKAR